MPARLLALPDAVYAQPLPTLVIVCCPPSSAAYRAIFCLFVHIHPPCADGDAARRAVQALCVVQQRAQAALPPSTIRRPLFSMRCRHAASRLLFYFLIRLPALMLTFFLIDARRCSADSLFTTTVVVIARMPTRARSAVCRACALKRCARMTWRALVVADMPLPLRHQILIPPTPPYRVTAAPPPGSRICCSSAVFRV